MKRLSLLAALLSCVCGRLEDVGVLTVVNEDLGKSVLKSVLERFSKEITEKKFNLEERDGSWTYVLNNLGVTHFSTNAVDVDFNSPQLTTNVHVGGNIKVETSWRISKKSWFGTSSTHGTAVANIKNFKINAQVELGEAKNKFTVANCPSCCDFEIGSFDMDFSGFWGWALSLGAAVFEKQIKKEVQSMVCQTANEVAEKATAKLISCQKTIVHCNINKKAVTVDNSPVYMMGTGNCGLLGFRGLMSTDYTPPTQEESTPFFAPAAPKGPTEAPQEKDVTEKEFTTTVSIPPTAPEDRQRSKRAVRGGCPTVPGHNIAVRIEERVIQNVVDTLHKMGFMNYKAIHDYKESEENIRFRQYLNGRYIGLTPVRDYVEKPSLYKEHDMSVKIKMEIPPTIYINSTGIIISSPLITRVKIYKNNTEGDGRDMTIKLEIPVVATFIVTVQLKKEGDEHWIVPAVQITAEIGDLQISNAFMQLFLQDQIKAGVKKMIEKTMRRVIEDELSEGYPLALPSILELDSADIRYYEDYIEISANVDKVNIELRSG